MVPFKNLKIKMFLLLSLAIKIISSASSKTHDAIDKIYDRIGDGEAPITSADDSIQIISAMYNDRDNENININSPSFLQRLNADNLLNIISYIEKPIPFSFTCKMMWNLVASISAFRIFNQPFSVDSIFHFNSVENSISEFGSLPAVLRAFGNRDLRVTNYFLAEHLELALTSPAFRSIFDARLWAQIRAVQFFQQRTETILMESNDSIARINRSLNLRTEAHRRVLLYILASLPLTKDVVKSFFHHYPVLLLKNSSTENTFHKLLLLICQRISLLSGDFISKKVLSMFAFDNRLIYNLLKIFLQTSEHSKLNILLRTFLPEEFRDIGQIYFGCVSSYSFYSLSRRYLNKLESEFLIILNEIETIDSSHFIPFLSALCGKYHQQLSINEVFHVAILKSNWNLLETFDNFDFSYNKDDSEFMSLLIQRDPNHASLLLNRVPRLASHKSFLQSYQFQSFHFNLFKNMRDARLELKRTINCQEITRAHIIYIHDNQNRLFNLLIADSADRIARYFSMNLKSFERKRYKEHPSFAIALTTLDVFLENNFMNRSDSPELDPEILLHQLLSEINVLPQKSNEYLELVHSLPSFSRAILAGGQEEVDNLSIPESAKSHNSIEFELLARTFSLDRVIHDGYSTNYRLVLNWFKQFGLRLAGLVIPVYDLRILLKGAAFHTIRTSDDNKPRFEIDPQNIIISQNLTYRYAIIILVTQCKGIRAAVIKRIKNLFPGGDFDSEDFNRYLQSACDHFRKYSEFFSNFKFVATNSRAERFLIDFIRHFISISRLFYQPLNLVANQFFSFIALNPNTEILLRDHFIYFIILALFKIKTIL